MSRLIDEDALKANINTAFWSEIGKIIDSAPTIDTISVEHGKWVEKEVLEDTVINEWQSARCSECGKYHTTPYMYYFDNFNFCPNCGADMRGTNNARHNIDAK